MKRVLLSLMAGFVSMYSFAQLSGTYTIDPNGSGPTNFTTWNAAVTALETNGVSGAVTLNVSDDTFNESVQLDAIPGSSTTNTVTFQADPSNTGTATLASNAFFSHTIRVDGTTNVTFKDLTFESTGSYNRTVYLASTNTNILFQNNVIKGYNITSTSNYYSSIYAYFCNSNNVVFDGNDISNTHIYMYYADDIEFTNNNIHDTYYYGMYMYNCDDVLVEGNYISAGGPSSYYGYGVYVYYGSGHKIIGNEIASKGYGYDYGISIRYHYGTSGLPTRIENNMIHAGNVPSYGTYGIYTYYTGNVHIKHNSIESIYGSNYTYGMALYSYSYSYTNMKIINNVVSNGPSNYGAYGAYIYAYNASSTYIDTIDGNVWDYNEGDLNNYFYGTGQVSSLSAWQSATGEEANAVVTDVPFMGGTDLHISPSMAALELDNTGIMTNVYDDYDGETRMGPDPGADEFTVPTNNAGADNLVLPDAPLCSNDTAVVVTVANTGLVALTSVDVYWALNGTTQGNVAWTGSLAVGSDTQVVVTSTASFVDGDTVKAWTAMPNNVNDSNAANDTATVVLYNGLSGTYNIPSDFPTLTDAANALNVSGVCDNVVIELSTNTYNEQMTLGDIVGAGPDATVTFTSASGNMDDAVIAYDATGSSVVTLNSGASYIYFEDITIENTSTSYTGGYTIVMNGAVNNISIDNSHIIGGSYYGYSYNMRAIHGDGGTYDDISITNSTVEGGSYATIWLNSSSGNRSDGITIENNMIKNCTYYYPVRLGYSDNVIFNNNEVTADTTVYPYNYGVYMYDISKFEVNGNRIGIPNGIPSPFGGNTGFRYGLYMYNCIGNSNPRSSIANNCINAGVDTTSGANYAYYGVYLGNSGFIDFNNNTVNKFSSTTSTYYLYSAMTISGGGLIEMANNSIADYSGSHPAFVLNGSFSLSASDYNNFHSEGSVLLRNGSGGNYSSVEDWNSAIGFDDMSISTDPNWENNYNCITCNDTMSNAGTPTGLMVDIDSNERSASAPDLGAVEWVSPATFTLGGDSTYCADEVTIEAGPAQSVTWSVNGNSSNDPYLTLTGGSEATTFNVLVSIQTEYCGSASDNALITLVPNANLDSNVHICADANATLDPGGLSSGSYSWSTGAATQTIVVDEPGVYTVTKDVMGCVSTATSAVSQSEAVLIVGTEVCSDDLPLTLDATIANGTSYAWSGGSAPTAATNEFNDAGAYTVTATDSYGCSSVDSFEVVVLEAPEAVITNPSYSGFIYVFDASSSPYLTASSSVNWNFGVGASPATSTNVMETVVYPWSNPSAPASYSVSLEINNGCGVDIATSVITPSLGIEDLAAGEFLIFPNPANDVVTVATKDVEAGNILILDMSGRTVATSTMSAGTNNNEINVSSLAAGSYIVKVVTDASTQMKQLIVQ